MKKSLLAAALVLATGAANAAPITTLTITGGDFAMAGAGGAINPAAFADMSVDGSTFDGSAPTATGSEAFYATTSIATFAFGFFGPVATYTAATDGVSSGFTPVTGELTGSDLTLDLNSWTAYWNGTSFNQGASGVATTVDASGNFTASWTALVVGGAFNGQTGSWSITGTTDAPPAVPVPAAVWLFGSGLLGLVGVARRKKAA